MFPIRIRLFSLTVKFGLKYPLLHLFQLCSLSDTQKEQNYTAKQQCIAPQI